MADGQGSSSLDGISDQDLAVMIQSVMDELHRRQSVSPDDAFKARFGRLLSIAHSAFDQLGADAIAAGRIKPFGGTDKPPPGP